MTDIRLLLCSLVKNLLAKNDLPLKYRWTIQLNLDDTPDPARLLAWLKENAAAAHPLTLRAIWPDLDNRTVILEPPRISRTRKAEGEWGGRVTLVMREG